MMTKSELVRKYYEEGLWGVERVRKAVEKGWLTEEEYAALTGEKY